MTRANLWPSIRMDQRQRHSRDGLRAFRGLPWERPESASKPPFRCEHALAAGIDSLAPQSHSGHPSPCRPPSAQTAAQRVIPKKDVLGR
jgi:hypothetical protein